MAQQSTVMDRLAWRAKWRKRFKKYKTLIVVVLLLGIGVPSFLAFTPYGPRKVREYIESRNPIDQPVTPWGTKWMYYLGRFYGMTMRKREAEDVYETLLYDWYADNGEVMEIPIGEPYSGYALFHLAQLKRGRFKTQEAMELFRWYMEDFAGQEGANPVYDQRAQQSLIVYQRN